LWLYQLCPSIFTYLTKLQHVTGVDLTDFIFIVVCAIKNGVHIEKFGAIEFKVAEYGDEHEEYDDL
jgi:hypothetical protein